MGLKLAQSVKMGAWMLITLNLLMAFGSIWVFVRMAPAIDVIIVQNEVSLQACQDMLAALAAEPENESGRSGNLEGFGHALKRAGNNVTEKEEPEVIERIERNHAAAFKGDREELDQTINAILELGTINRNAMRKADRRAQQLGHAGAWGIVFMATTVFLVGMIFLRSLKANLTEPLQEINATLDAFRKGDAMRRCSLNGPPRNIKQVLDKMNDVLDKCSINKMNTNGSGEGRRQG